MRCDNASLSRLILPTHTFNCTLPRRVVRFSVNGSTEAKVGVAIDGGGVDMTNGVMDYSSVYGEVLQTTDLTRC